MCALCATKLMNCKPMSTTCMSIGPAGRKCLLICQQELVHDNCCALNKNCATLTLNCWLFHCVPFTYRGNLHSSLHSLNLVYIQPRAKESSAIDCIRKMIDKLELISLDGPKLILGDFNHYSVDRSLKGFFQYINCPTRSRKCKCYGSVPEAFEAIPLPPLGFSDHLCILRAPAYLPVVKRSENKEGHQAVD